MKSSNSKKPVITDGTVATILLGLTHNGTQRSFALNLKGQFIEAGLDAKTANDVAWEISREIKEKKLEFTKKNAEVAIPHHVSFQLFEHAAEEKDRVKKAKKKNMTEPKQVAPVKTALSAKHMDIAKNEKIAKNERIRLLLIDGASQTGIATAMGIEFQRVKNVKKPLDNARAKEQGKNAKSLAENPYTETDERMVNKDNPTGLKQKRLYDYFVEGFESKKK